MFQGIPSILPHSGKHHIFVGAQGMRGKFEIRFSPLDDNQHNLFVVANVLQAFGHHATLHCQNGPTLSPKIFKVVT